MDCQESPEPERHALIIEDDALLNRLFGKWFERLGYVVHHAFTGAEGLACIDKQDFDTVMLDQHLPDTTGAELYPLLRARQENLQVVVCSAFEPEGPLREVVRRGEASFIRKPCFFKDLLAALGELNPGTMSS